MKKIILFVGILVIAAVFANAQDSAIKKITDHFAANKYLTTPVTQAELDQIIQAAVHAPSARNRQPWHFTVVQNADLAKQIISNVTNGNALIVVSAQGDGKTNNTEILDAALATQSIYLAAQAIGLGSRIYTGPIDTVNKNLKAALGLPSGYSAVAVVRIGKIEQVDAVSAASSRKKISDVVTYKK
jgi:nitroreductase